jgi:hypothetical protein
MDRQGQDLGNTRQRPTQRSVDRTDHRAYPRASVRSPAAAGPLSEVSCTFPRGSAREDHDAVTRLRSSSPCVYTVDDIPNGDPISILHADLVTHPAHHSDLRFDHRRSTSKGGTKDRMITYVRRTGLPCQEPVIAEPVDAVLIESHHVRNG